MPESQNLLAGGMLITKMMGLRMTDDGDRDPNAAELLTAAFPAKLDLMRSLVDPERELKRETEA